MAGPNYGALGATFKCVRLFQAICMIGLIGMTANFISEMISANDTPSDILVGTLSVTCISVLYCVITFILYIDDILPFLINTVMDSLFLIAVIVIAVVVGKPLSYLNCRAIGSANAMGDAYEFTTSLGNNFDKNGGQLTYNNWIGASRTNCYEMKAIWGLSISLCVLFAMSSICSACLWRRKAAGPPKSVDA